MKRDVREDRPSNTSDGRDLRELESRWIEERKVKGETEDEGDGGKEENERENEGC